MSRTYTAVHWLGAAAIVEYFTAETDGAALAAFEEMGWNAYDDRRLLNGRIDPVDCVPPGYSYEVTETDDAAELERDRQRELDANTHEHNERLANGQNVY